MPEMLRDYAGKIICFCDVGYIIFVKSHLPTFCAVVYTNISCFCVVFLRIKLFQKVVIQEMDI